MSTIDWRAVGVGAGVAVAGLGGTVVLVEVVDAAVGIEAGSNWIFAFYALALTGLALGGWLAARGRSEAPLLHGLLASVGGYVLVAAVVVVVRTASDRDSDPVALAFNGLMAATAGIVGTIVAERRSSAPR